MSTALKIIDADDLATVLFDLNGSNTLSDGTTVTCAFGLGGTFNLASPATEYGRFSPTSAAGGSTTYARDPLVNSSLRLRMSASSYDVLAAGVGELSRLLRAGGVMLWQPNGASARYIDFEPSPAAALLNGTPVELLQVISQFDTPQGVDISFWRQPYLRAAQVDSATNILTNPTMLMDATTGDKNPDGWAWSDTTNIGGTTYSVAQEAWTNTIATTDSKWLTQLTAASTVASGETWTFSFYVKASAAGIAKAQAQLEFYQADGTTIVGSTNSGTLTDIGTSWVRLTVAGTAGALTSRANCLIKFANASASSVSVYPRNSQLEEAASATTFTVSSGSVDGDPAQSFGRVMPVWIEGNAPAPVRIRTNGVTSYVVGARSRDFAGKRGLADYLNVTRLVQCEAMTNGTNSSDLGTAGASAGTVVANDWGGTTGTKTLATHLTHSITNNLDSLEGTYDVYVRVAATAATMTGTFRLDYGTDSTGSNTVALSPVTYSLDTGYQNVRLGRIYLPDTAEALYLILKASRTSTADVDLYWDVLTFVPAEDMTAAVSGAAYTESEPGVGAFKTSSTWTRKGLAGLEGPTPLTLPPGLSIIHLAPSDGATDTMADTTVALAYYPRYVS